MAPRQKPGEHRNASRFEALSFSDAGALLTANRPLQVAPYFPTLFTYLQLGCLYTDVSTNNTPYGTHVLQIIQHTAWPFICGAEIALEVSAHPYAHYVRGGGAVVRGLWGGGGRGAMEEIPGAVQAARLAGA